MTIKVGEFIYPWGDGHYTRMMRFDSALRDKLGSDMEAHYTSGSPIYEKLLEVFPDNKQNIHRVGMPTPIDGMMGPNLTESMLNVLLPVHGRSPLVSRVTRYLKEERRIYDKEHFDLVVNDGDVGSNILARNRNIPSMFVTNQFRPTLWKSRMYLYPGVAFIARQIAHATKILVADSAPPHTMCEYNLNFPEKLMRKVEFVGHFAQNTKITKEGTTNLEKLTRDVEFGYWMRTGNKSTNDGTGARYEQVFGSDRMKHEKRIISHARRDPGIDSVTGMDGQKYSIPDAAEKSIDWIQIDVGYLSERDMDSILERCQYAVFNGSHTVMGEIIGVKSKPVIGMPIYDEHTNNIRWAQERGLGVLANNTSQVLEGICKIKDGYDRFERALEDYAVNFEGNGAENAAHTGSELLKKAA